MSALLTSTAIGLLAAWPASGLGWALGKAADAITDDPPPRAQAWALARALPVATLGLMTLASQLPASVAPPIVRVMAASDATATVSEAAQTLAGRGPTGLDPFAAGAAALIATAAGGFAVAAVRQVLGLRRLARIVRDAQPAPHALTLATRTAARRLAVACPPLLVSAAVDQPLLAGFFEPAILLPTALVEELATERLALICAHELAHLKRRDNWRLLIESLVGGLFWMVPPAVTLRARAAAVREELCDGLALADAPIEARRSYAESLIAVLRLRAAPSPYPAFTGKEGHPTAMRLKAIIAPRRPAGLARKTAIAAIGALVAAGVGACSLATADHKTGGHTLTRVTISSSETNQFIDISAERAQILGKNRSAYEGGIVRIKGRLKNAETVVLLDGRPAPAGFDATRLPAGAIQRIELTTSYGDVDGRVLINVILAKGGQASAEPSKASKPIMLMADRQIVSKDGGPMQFVGGPSISGDTTIATYRVNGAPPPPNFDPTALDPETVDRLEVTEAVKTPDRKLLINVVMKAV